jgi:Fe-Mn family superoxide dismutase
MKKQFTDAATSRFGSGWAWLGVKPDGQIAITSTANQGNILPGHLSFYLIIFYFIR